MFNLLIPKIVFHRNSRFKQKWNFLLIYFFVQIRGLFYLIHILNEFP